MPATIASLPADAPRECGPRTRREWRTVLLVVAVGFVLRAALPGRMAIEHFDEGVYASNLYSGNQDPPHAYPDRHLYAPPLFPGLLEWAIIASGGRPHAAMWVNVLAGAVMIFVIWRGTRQWFGPGAGIAAATLAATSDCHIAFSRTALTDVTLCLWMAAGVFAGWRAVLTGRVVWIGLAAACSALAWWTKYNGWLALAVTGSGTVAWLLLDHRRTVGARTALGRWTAVAGVAALLWLPFLWTIPAGSTYAEISANHAKYFVGPAGWWHGLSWHATTQRYLDGWITATGIAAGVVLAAWVDCERFTWNGNLAGGAGRSRLWILAGGLAAGVGALALGSTIVLALFALAGAASAGRWAFRRPASPAPKQDVPSADEAARLADWMSAAWFIGLLAATPLYHPYPRLALPWLMACWVAAGAAVGRLLERSANPIRQFTGSGPGQLAAPVVAAALLVVLAAPIAAWRGSPLVPPRWTAWQNRTGLERIAADVLRDAALTVGEFGRSGHPQLDAVLYVAGEPGLFFQLEAAHDERYVCSPTTSLALRDPIEVAVFLVTGPHAHRSGSERDPAVQQYRPIAAYPYHPSDLVALDEYPASRLSESGGPPTEEVRLYLVHGPLRAR